MTGLLTLRSLSEYARRPLNLVLLAVVPVVFVTLSAGALAEFADLLGGLTAVGTVEAASAGWAAAILAGVSGFFHVAGSRDADRRLAAAGAGTLRVVTARLASGFVLAAVASIGALVALAARTGIADVPRAVGATIGFAVIYLAIGAALGGVVRSEMNGSLALIFLWMFDVFFGPAMGGTSPLIRVLPLHFPTLVVTDVSSGHAGPLGDVGISLAWTVGALAMAAAVLVATTRPARSGTARRVGSWSRLRTGLRYGLVEYRRNIVLWLLLVGLPIVFITLSFAVTPDNPAPVELAEAGRRSIRVLSMVDVHGAIMGPITVGFLAGLAGLFVVLGSADADRRLVLSGFKVREVLGARLGVVGLAAALVTAVALAVTAVDFTPQRWVPFAAGTLLVALTYAMLGVLVGPLVGRLGGLYLMLLLPFIDAGLAQNPMFDAAPPSWATLMPAHGAVRVLLDGAFTPGFDETGALLLALAWLAAVTAAAAGVFRWLAAPERT